LIPGHEFAGRVVSVGPDTSADWIGRLVAVFPLLWCGQCASCEVGAYARCSDYDYLGSRRNGAFAEYAVAPVRNLKIVPAGVSAEAAGMTEPAAVALHALRRAGTAVVGAVVAVFGAGPIGQLTAQWAGSLGASDVVLFDMLPERLELARTLGFARVHDVRSASAQEVVRDLSGGAGAAVCVEASGAAAALRDCIGCAANGGVVVVMGNPSGDALLPSATVSAILRKELAVLGTWNSLYSEWRADDDWSVSLESMSLGRIQPAALVSHRVGIEEGVAAFEMIREKREFVSKVLIGGGDRS